MRKVRSDKKRDIKPLIPDDLYETIARISYITRRPLKDIGVEICERGLLNKDVIVYLSKRFKRDYWFSEHNLIPGREVENQSRTIKIKGKKRRLTMRFEQSLYERISEICYAMDLTISSGTYLLLEAAAKNKQVIQPFIKNYLDENLDTQKKKKLRAVIKFINKHNPYEDTFTFDMLVNIIINEYMYAKGNFKQAVSDFIDRFIDFPNEKTHSIV